MTKNERFFLNPRNSIIFGHFSLFSNALTFHKINRFFRFFLQIKALFFYFNRFFVEYLFSLLRACYWLIITEYFSSIFPMLHFHKKNEFQLPEKHYSDFLSSTLFSYIIQRCASTFFVIFEDKLGAIFCEF